MSNFLKINDLVKFSLVSSSLMQVKDDYEGAFKPESQAPSHASGLGTTPQGFSAAQQQLPGMGPGLQIRIAATHAGIITRNNGFYLPDKMQKGSKTFVSDYPKPVLLHHQDHEDPIGRVIAAHYVDTSGLIQDKYAGKVVRNKAGKEIGVISETLIKDFVSDKMPFGQQIDVIRTLFQDSLLEDTTYDGLGHIEIVANISKPDSIEKLLDGRYLTGSVGATTDKAVCSVCRTDWTDSGKCDHTPGGVYDDAKCFIIAGNLVYDEYSFVNVPADRHSKVLELHYNGIQDNIKVKEEYLGRIYEVQLGFPQYDLANKEEGRMSLQDEKNKDSATTDPKADTQPQETENTSVTVEDTATSDDTTEEVTDIVTQHVATEGIEDLVIRVLSAEEVDFAITDEEDEKLYNYLWQEVLAAVADGELVLSDEVIQAAKLSTEARKKLPKSTFCGPGKSFPVPDCAHVTAARRLIGRAKITASTKSSILSCVSRKSKAMGCGSSTSDSVNTNIQENMDHARVMRMILNTLEEDIYFGKEPVLNEEELGSLQAILVRMAKMVGQDSFHKAVIDAELAHDESQLLDEVAKNEEEIGDLRERIVASQKEYNLLFRDMEVLQDQLTGATLGFRKQQESHLKTLVALKDQKVEEVNYSELSDAEVSEKLELTGKSVDMIKITDKLGDGMSRVIADGETVDSPIEIQDSNQKKEVSVTDLATIEEEYLTRLYRDGSLAANTFRIQMIREGRLPQDSDNN